MVAQPVTVPAAGWTGPLGIVHRVTKPVTQSNHKLSGLQEETQARVGDNVQPITRVRILNAK